jgi:hypothetical protein
MPVSPQIQIAGVKETLRELSKLDKEAAKELRREARQIMKPIVTTAKTNIPDEALSGMSRAWTSNKVGAQLTPWNGSTARKYVKAKTSTKRPKEFNGVVRDLAVFYVSWAGGVNMLFDMAGRRNKSVMAANLTGKFGPPSRIMWPAAEKNAPEVEREMKTIIDKLVKLTNERISGVSS